jgi:hypothetical protein
MFDIKNPNSFLGGQNVHNLIIIGLLIYIIFKLMKNSEKESSYGITCPQGKQPCKSEPSKCCRKFFA